MDSSPANPETSATLDTTPQSRRAAAVIARRAALSWSKREASERSRVSIPTWGRLEDPEATRTPRQATLKAASVGLGWDENALARIGAGEDPESIPISQVETTTPKRNTTNSIGPQTSTSDGDAWTAAADLLQMVSTLPTEMRSNVVEHVRLLHRSLGTNQ